MSQLSTAVNSFRKALLTREGDSLSEMVVVFLEAYGRIDERLIALQQTIAERRKAGIEITDGYVIREERFVSLLTQIGTELTAYAAYAGTHISEQQRIAVYDAQQHSSELIRLALGSGDGIPLPPTFTRYNPVAVLDLVGKLSSGSPLKELLDTISPEAVSKARSVLVTSLVAGDNPKRTAAALRDELNISLTRALTIARTEVLGAYRQASIDTYAANKDVVAGWIWYSELGPLTCAMCMAMHGSRHSLDEPFGSHPNCRCTPVPETFTWEELGFPGIPDNRPEIEQGTDWFAKQSEEVQRAILGKDKLNLYKAGDLPLTDLIGTKDDSKWGLTRYEKSLKAVLADR